jgi:hypothetical protein
MASSQSLWSQSPTVNQVTNLAESIVSRASGRTHEYSVRRTAIDSWEVHYVGHNDYGLETDRRPTSINLPISIFTCICRVLHSRNDILCCDCGGQHQVGLPCVHTITIMENCFPNWKGPTHHNASLRWWLTWLEFAHKPETKIITPAMLELIENEVPSPRIPGPEPLSPSYFPFTSNQTSLNCTKNHTQELLCHLVPSPQVIQQGNALRTTVTKEGLMQESYIVGTLLRATITNEGLMQESHDDEE